MSEVVNQINETARGKKAAEQRAAAEQKAKAEAPPVELVNIRNVRPAPEGVTPGSLIFPGDDGFELRSGDNLIDVAKLTSPVQAQLVDWVNCGWVEVVSP